MEVKPTLLLATTLFLISAPEPDSRTIAEATANFIVPTDERALRAAEGSPGEGDQSEAISTGSEGRRTAPQVTEEPAKGAS